MIVNWYGSLSLYEVFLDAQLLDLEGSSRLANPKRDRDYVGYPANVSNIFSDFVTDLNMRKINYGRSI